MQVATETLAGPPTAGFAAEAAAPEHDVRYAQYKVIRRNGAVVGFEPAKISIAMTKAFIAVNGGVGAASARIREVVAQLTTAVVNALIRRRPEGGTFHIEDIQDQVELALMRCGEHEVARAYVLYREARAQERARQREAQAAPAASAVLHVTEGGERRPLDQAALRALVEEACEGLGSDVSPEPILQATWRDIYDGIPMVEVRNCLVLAARSLIEAEPAYC